MKLKQLINGGALAATVLTLGSAQAEKNPYDGIVFCKATIVSSGEDSIDSVSITLPFTTTGSDGEQYTYWNLGQVQAGGVADTWHGEGGPGKFVAHNNGGVGAYVYLTSASQEWYERWQSPGVSLDDFFGRHPDEFVNTEQIHPIPSLQYWRMYSKYDKLYCLAFSRDVEAKIPTWHMLNMFTESGKYGSSDNSPWQKGENYDGQSLMYIGAYMGYLDAGDYMPFDVKFWAPHVPNGWEVKHDKGEAGYEWPYRGNVRFTFMVEAAPFPLWEHDIEVQ